MLAPSKAAIANLTARLKDANIVVDLDPLGDRQRAMRQQLRAVNFKTISPCRAVTIVMAASGEVTNIAIADGALRRYSADEMSRLLTDTISTAIQTANSALVAIVHHQLRK